MKNFTCAECHVTLCLTPKRHCLKNCPCGKLYVDYEKEDDYRTIGPQILEDVKESELPNWFEIPVTLPAKYKDWVKKNMKPKEIKEINRYHHITLLYGFEPKYFWAVKKLAESFGPFGEDFEYGEVRDGDKNRLLLPSESSDGNVKFVPIKSDTLQKCFDVLSKTFKNQHYVHKGQYLPHVTLCYFI